jgi:ribosome-associated protein
VAGAAVNYHRRVIEIAPGLQLADDEVRFVASRSGGPGGQNVNKVETRVTLLFDLEGSLSLSEEQRRRIRERLPGRISADGILRVSSQRHRSQAANRRAALERFIELLAQALRPRAKRVATRPTAASRARRIADKRRRARLKADRATRPDDD